MSYDIYTGLLKVFALPAERNSGINFSYDFDHPKFNELKEKYPIEAVAGVGDSFTRAVNLLRWVSGHIYHKGNNNSSTAQNSLELLKYAFDKDASYRLMTLCPHGYDPKRMRMANIEYRIRKNGDNANMKKWKKGAMKEQYVFCSAPDFEMI